MNKFFTLIIAGLLFANTAMAGIDYSSPATGYVTISNKAQWDAIAWINSGVNAYAFDQYIIQPGFTVLVGPNGNHDIDFTAATVYIQVDGRLGFYHGNNTISMEINSGIIVNIGGQVGFADANGEWYGDAGDRFYFGTNPTDYVKGPFYVFGPDQIFLNNPPESSYLWTGAVSTAWTNGGNWITRSGNPSYPTENFNAVIPTSPSGGNFPHISTTGNKVKALALQPGAQITVESNGTLTLYDSIHNYGTFTVKSGGAFVQTTNSKSCDYCPGGTFNIERNLTGLTSPWYMGSPIASLPKSTFSSCGNGQFVPGPTCDAPVTGNTSPCVMALNQDATTTGINCSHSLWSYSTAGNFRAIRGYAVYAAPGVMTFSGADVHNGYYNDTLFYSNKGPVDLPDPFPGTTTRGWHMVSNPYPSPVTFTNADLNGLMGLDGQIQLWNSAVGNWVTPNPSSPYTVGVGQGFQVRVSGGAGNVGMFWLDNSFRVATTGTSFYKTEDVPQTEYVNITLSNGNTAQNSTAMVYFQAGATDAFDGLYDANRLFGLGNLPYLYTVEQNGEFLAYNALPSLVAGTSKSVPVGVHAGIVGALTLTFEGINTINATVVLEDLKTGALYPVTEGYVHNFTAQTGDSPNRFVLHFNAATVSGIANTTNSAAVSLFPNPTTGRATIMFSEYQGFTKVVVIDLAGRVVYSDAITKNENNKTFDISGISSGIYTVKLIGSTTATTKLVKQ